jgi:hypothetical protein
MTYWGELRTVVADVVVVVVVVAVAVVAVGLDLRPRDLPHLFALVYGVGAQW